jgi:hypothetical protein
VLNKPSRLEYVGWEGRYIVDVSSKIEMNFYLQAPPVLTQTKYLIKLCIRNCCMELDIAVTVTMNIAVLWNMGPCSLVNSDKRSALPMWLNCFCSWWHFSEGLLSRFSDQYTESCQGQELLSDSLLPRKCLIVITRIIIMIRRRRIK